MADDLIQDLLKAYNNLDERIGGVLPGGAATRILGTQAVLNGKPVRWDGKDWISPEDFNKRNESKVGYSLAQPIRDKLNQIVSNPVVNTGLQIGSMMLKNAPAQPLFNDLPLIGKSPMDMLGEASGLITEGISDATNVDPLPIDIALAALPFGKAGVSKLLKGLKVGKGLKTVNQFALPTSKRTPTTNLPADLQELVNLKELADGSWGAGAGLAINPKHLDFAVKQMLGDAQQLAKYTPAAATLNLNPFPSTSVSEDKLGNEQIETSANIIRNTYRGLLDSITVAESNLPTGIRTNTHLSTLKAEAGDYKRKLSLLLSTYADRQLVKDQRKFFDDLANAGDNPELIRKAINNNFGRIKSKFNISGSSNLGPEFRLDAHHELYAIESALQLMNVPPEIRREVLRIQLDRGRRYSDHRENLTALFKDPHNLAHPQGTAADSSKYVEVLRNMHNNPTAQEIADAMEDVAVVSKDLSLKAGQSKAQIQTAWDFANAILSPKEIQYFIKQGLNFADTKNPLWQEFRKFIEGSGRLHHVGDQSRALFDSMVLESESIA